MESTGNLPYHHMVEELREKLRISEESRKSLQQKFDAMMLTYKAKEQARYNALRKRYGAFLEEDQRRQQRNENLLQMLERIDNRSASLAARTERLALLRKHYEQYLGQLYPSWKVPHRMSTGSIPVKIREYFEEDVSGYGTHTGSSGYVRESERYEEPRMPPISTQRASTHLYKTDNVLPDKYRIPRVDFDMPTISVTKPAEERRSSVDVRTPKVDLGRHQLNKIPDVARKSMAVSPRDRTPTEHFIQPELEVDQNTSGDLLNMSLSDDGVSSLTRSETDAVARHHHWETLRQAYINRQPPAYNERRSIDEFSQDMGWSGEKPLVAYDYSERPLQQELPSEEVSIERESFRDKIRRLKVMIQENKQLEQTTDEPVNDKVNNEQRERTWVQNSNNETDNAFQNQRVRRQSVIDGHGLVTPLSSENIYSQPGDRSSNNDADNAFQRQRVRRQSVVDGQGLVNPQTIDNGYSRPAEKSVTDNGKIVQHQENVSGERKMSDGTPRRRMSILPYEQIRPDHNNGYQRTEQQSWAQSSEERPSSFEGERSYMPEQQKQQLEPLRESEGQEVRTVQTQPQLQVERKPELRNQEHGEKQGSEERPLYQEAMSRKQSMDSAQRVQYMEQNRDYNTNSTDPNASFRYTSEQYPNEQTRPVDYNGTQQGDFIGTEQGNEKQQDNYIEVNPRDMNNGSLGQEINRYPEGGSSNFGAPDSQNNTHPPDSTIPSEQYYQNISAFGDREQAQEQGFYNDPNQNYDGQGQGYNYNQDVQYDYQYQTNQPDSNYYAQQQDQGENASQEQKTYAPSNEQEYYQDYGQQDPSNAEYDPNQQYPQQYENQQQQQYDPQQGHDSQQQYDPQQQHDSQQQYDPQQQHDSQQQQYDPQQQHDSHQQYDPQQQLYEGDSYGWQQSSNQQEQQPGGTQEQYQYYGQQNQEAYEYAPQNEGRNDYEYPQQNSNGNYSTSGGTQQGETAAVGVNDRQGNQPREETTNKYYQDISDESTQESEKSRELPMCASQESPSQRSIDRYRTILGGDPNSDPAYSEVDEIEDEMAAVVASGMGTGRMQAANNVTPTTEKGQNQPKPLETNPKHDDSSDFDYSSGP